MSAALSIIIPPVARFNKELFIAVRVLQGLVEGVMYPVYYTMASKWLPREEKAILTTIIMFGR